MTVDASPASADTSASYYGLRWWREVVYILAFYLVYSWIRNQFGSEAVSPAAAFDNARQVIDVEKALGLYVEPTIQGWFISTPTPTDPAVLHYGFPGAKLVVQFWNIFYGTFHFVVTAGALVWLYRRHPSVYRKWRTILAVTTGVALVGFSLYPLMPPRLLPSCGEFGACADFPYIDTLSQVGSLWSFDSGTMQKVSNQFAAMPSLHFGWALWCLAAIYPRTRARWARVLIGLYPAATLFAIIVTANHYWIDAVGGAVLFTVGYGAGTVGTRWFERWRGLPSSDAASPGPEPQEYGAVRPPTDGTGET